MSKRPKLIAFRTTEELYVVILKAMEAEHASKTEIIENALRMYLGVFDEDESIQSQKRLVSSATKLAETIERATLNQQKKYV